MVLSLTLTFRRPGMRLCSNKPAAAVSGDVNNDSNMDPYMYPYKFCAKNFQFPLGI